MMAENTRYTIRLLRDFLIGPIKKSDFIMDHFGGFGRCTAVHDDGLIECSMYAGFHAVGKFVKISYGIYDIDKWEIIGLVSLGAIWVRTGDTLKFGDLERGGGAILFYTEDLRGWRKSDTDTMPGKTGEGDYYYVKILNGSCNCYH